MSTKTLLTLKIFMPEGNMIEKSDLLSININLDEGHPIGIRPGHAPLIASTKKGAVTIHSSQEDTVIKLHAGVMEIRNNTVIILTAGLMEQTPSEPESSIDVEFNRLMQALVNQLEPESDTQSHERIT